MVGCFGGWVIGRFDDGLVGWMHGGMRTCLGGSMVGWLLDLLDCWKV